MKKMNLWLIGLSFFVFSCNNASDNQLSATNTATIPASPSFEALQNDDDIIWMAEHDIVCSPNFDSYTSSSEDKKLFAEVGFTEKNTIKILKYQVQSIEDPSDANHRLTHKIIESRNDLDCYKDAALTTLLSTTEKAKLMGHVDTIITFDSKTNQELLRVVVNSTNPEDILFFKVKHLLYYSKKEMMFKMKALAIAPMIMDYNDDLQYLGMKAMFWTPVDDLVQTPDIDNKDNTWATRIYHNFSVENLKVVKGTKDIAEILDIMVEDLSKNAEDVYVANTFDADGSQKMSVAEIRGIQSSIDTIITFDAATLKENLAVIKNEFNSKNVKSIRLMQDWVWNHQNKSLSISYLGFKPIINRYANSGKLINSGPMFTRRVGWDGKK
jgi:hypothetical protein